MWEYLERASEIFWSESVWLPPNTTWKDIAPEPGKSVTFPNSKHLYYPIPVAFLMLGLRYLLERYWFAPVGLSLGIKNNRSKRAPPNPILEKAYQSKSKLSHKQVQGLAKQVDMSERQVERWLRLRRSQDKPSTLVKFCENSWRCFYYTISFIYGLTILWSKPWLWDINECWYTFPNQSVTTDLWFYYMMNLTFYWSLCFSHFFDVIHKDFWQMFIHHVATIVLMSFSWIGNLVRIGSLVILVHDCADVFLEAAKMTKYSGYQRVCDVIFAIFTILWLITRIGLFPFWIIRSINYDAPQAKIPGFLLFVGLLDLLLVLHIFWTFLIFKVIYKVLITVKLGDIRSDSSELSQDCVLSKSDYS